MLQCELLLHARRSQRVSPLLAVLKFPPPPQKKEKKIIRIKKQKEKMLGRANKHAVFANALIKLIYTTIIHSVSGVFARICAHLIKLANAVSLFSGMSYDTAHSYMRRRCIVINGKQREPGARVTPLRKRIARKERRGVPDPVARDQAGARIYLLPRKGT